MSEIRGPVILREKPRTELADRPAYLLHEDNDDRESYEAAADWVRFYGGTVKYVDHEGLLIASYDEDGCYHEWIEAPALITYWPEHNEFSTYGTGMTEHYVAELEAPGSGGL